MLPVHRRNTSTTGLASKDNGGRDRSQDVHQPANRLTKKHRRRKTSFLSSCYPPCFCMPSSPLDRARRRRIWLQYQQNPRSLRKYIFVAMLLVGLVFMSSTTPILAALRNLEHGEGQLLHLSDVSGAANSPLRVPSPGRSMLSGGEGLYKILRPKTRRPDIPILLNIFSTPDDEDPIALPPEGVFDASDYEYPDFGDLKITFYEENIGRRLVIKDLTLRESHFRHPDRDNDDSMDGYYFLDDDGLRGREANYNAFDVHDTKRTCRRVAEHHLHFPTCNPFHEVDRLEPRTDIKFIAAGGFREVFAVTNMDRSTEERIVMKDYIYKSDVDYEAFEYIRMDAIVAERLTASPRIYDVYAHCGLGIMSEYFVHRDIERDTMKMDTDGYLSSDDLDDKDAVKPQNTLTGIEKLVLGLEMAEALADLHGYVDNLIIHDDVQLSQFLFNKNKARLKLNDFNRAEMPLFDEENQEYCRYKNGRGHGNWRSPEEYKNEPLTEQIDIWSLGCNMYGILTGLNPLYNIDSSDEHKDKIKKGVKPYIDPRYRTRSPGEDLFVDVIMKCFEYQPHDRPNVFQIVEMLRKAVASTLDPGVTKAEVLVGVKTLV